MSISDRMSDMMTRFRPMAVLDDGVWQAAEGVWIDVTNYKARCFLRGKELICDGKHFLDLDGYRPSEVAGEIIRRNISLLPRLQRKSKPIQELPRRANAFRPPLYRIVNRNGRPHAMPYHDNPFPADIPAQAIPQEPPAGNNA